MKVEVVERPLPYPEEVIDVASWIARELLVLYVNRILVDSEVVNSISFVQYCNIATYSLLLFADVMGKF